jgi:signal transduction histidine kinase
MKRLPPEFPVFPTPTVPRTAPVALVLSSSLFGLSVTLAVSLRPSLRSGFPAPMLQAALLTSQVIVAALAVALAVGRFLEGRSSRDLVLAATLELLGAASLLHLLLVVVPPGRLGLGSDPLGLASIVLRTGSAVVLASWSWSRVADPKPGRSTPPALLAAAGTAAVVLLTQLGLPDGSGPARTLLIGLGLVEMGASATAALGLLFWAERSADRLPAWLAAGCALNAFAGIAAVPAFRVPGVTVEPADLLRFGLYLMLLAGIAHEIGASSRLAGAAVQKERRRIERDLHDGPVQELSFIASHATRLRPPVSDDAGLPPEVVAAAERALDEVRWTMAALSHPGTQPLDEAIAATAEHVAARVGARVSFRLDGRVDVPPQAREALLRILREAVTNAGRHGKASTVVVELVGHDRVRLRISDDGIGFDPEAAGRRGGFGLVSMRERSEMLGGRLRIRSWPGAGTEVEVEL